MKVIVLKPFAYGADGIHSVDLAKGDKAEIADSLVPGLVKEGFVKLLPAKPETKPPQEGKPDLVDAAAAKTAAAAKP